MTNQTHFRVSRARSKVDSTGLCSDEGGGRPSIYISFLSIFSFIFCAQKLNIKQRVGIGYAP